MINTLYHPYFEPKEGFLRAMLLFYDTVYSIVPEQAQYTPTPGISALREKVEEAFVPLSPREQELKYDDGNYKALYDVLRELSAKREGKDRVLTRVDWSQGVPSLDLGRSVRVHTGKMADLLAHDLIDLELAEREDDYGWLRVDRRAADLVLSMLADRMSKNRSDEIYNTSSDRESSFAVAAKSDLRHRKPPKTEDRETEAILASAVLTTAIPADLAELPLDRYLDIRKRYEGKQKAFQVAMEELRELHSRRRPKTPEDFNEQLESIVTKFGREMQDLREKQLKRRVSRWALISLGGIVTVAATAIANPVIAMGASGAGYVMQTLLSGRGEPPHDAHGSASVASCGTGPYRKVEPALAGSRLFVVGRCDRPLTPAGSIESLQV